MADTLFGQVRVAIRGGGDLGSGVAYRLFRCGFPVLITELPHPLLLRRAVSFGSVVLQKTITVEGVTARLSASHAEAISIQSAGEIPVLIDPEAKSLVEYDPQVLVDARMLKRYTADIPFKPTLFVGLGPGFSAPENCDAAVETNRGHHLGRVFRNGATQPDTGQPGSMMGHAGDRVLRAPIDGVVTSSAVIGAAVRQGDPIASVNGQVVAAPFDGVLRGLVHDGVHVSQGVKIADVDPRGDPVNSVTISEKALAIGGGVVEAVLSSPAIHTLLRERQ